MRDAGRWSTVLVAATIWWVAGCTPATRTTSPSVAPFPTESASARAAPTTSASPAATPGHGGEIEIGRLDPELTDSILEFVSDGSSIVFSASLAADAARNAAPDLWSVPAVPDAQPELLWRNPARDHSIVKIAADLGLVAFVDIPVDGSRAWDLWLIPRHESEAIHLDTHPGNEEVSSLVPSMSVQEQTIVWTAFDAGVDGPVSQLLVARAPDWKPTRLLERRADERELWFPSLHGARVAFCEVVYSPDRTSDERRVYVLGLGRPDAEPMRLDDSGLATMPVLIEDTVIWKEADRGFSMFNWGLLWRHDPGAPKPRKLAMAPVDYVDNPSGGSRFVASWAANSAQLVVYDLLEDRPRVIERYTGDSQANALRPHIAWDLLVWLYAEGEIADGHAEIRYAFLPPVRSPP